MTLHLQTPPRDSCHIRYASRLFIGIAFVHNSNGCHLANSAIDKAKWLMPQDRDNEAAPGGRQPKRRWRTRTWTIDSSTSTTWTTAKEVDPGMTE